MLVKTLEIMPELPDHHLLLRCVGVVAGALLVLNGLMINGGGNVIRELYKRETIIKIYIAQGTLRSS